MSSSRFFTRFALAAICVAAPAAAIVQTQSANQVIVPLTDPSRPAVLSVSAFGGSILVRGVNRRDVMVRSSENGRGRRQSEPPPAGLRRLTPEGGFRVEERNNEITVEAASCAGLRDPNPPNPNPNPGGRTPPFIPPIPKGLPCGPLVDSTDFEIEVPLRTNVTLSTMNGDISVTSVEGELEVNSVNGDLSLASVAGSIVAHTVNGDVTAALTRAAADAPMAFTTLNGQVDVTLPPTIKANLKLRTDNGDVFTDFDIPAMSSGSATRSTTRDGRFRFEVERAVVANLNGGGPDIELRSFNGRVYLRRGK
jgi:hypothetical protein